MLVMPVAGREVRDPTTGYLLDVAGQEVADDDLFWVRRYYAGDVTIDTLPPDWEVPPVDPGADEEGTRQVRMGGDIVNGD